MQYYIGLTYRDRTLPHDEYALVSINATSEKQAHNKALQIRNGISEPFEATTICIGPPKTKEQKERYNAWKEYTKTPSRATMKKSELKESIMNIKKGSVWTKNRKLYQFQGKSPWHYSKGDPNNNFTLVSLTLGDPRVYYVGQDWFSKAQPAKSPPESYSYLSGYRDFTDSKSKSNISQKSPNTKSKKAVTQPSPPDSNNAAQQAKQRGLTSAGWGRWKDKSGKVVAKTVDGKLVMTTMKKSELKESIKNEIRKLLEEKSCEEKITTLKSLEDPERSMEYSVGDKFVTWEDDDGTGGGRVQWTITKIDDKAIWGVKDTESARVDEAAGAPNIEAATNAFLKKLQAASDAYYKKNFPSSTPAKFSIDKGRKFSRIVKDTGQRMAFGFIDNSNGDLLMAAGWKVPAKNGARGNILGANSLSGTNPYGVNYKGQADKAW